MRRKAYLIAVLITAIGILGMVETLDANPDGSQRLRGLGGRTFLVQVSLVVPPPAPPVFLFNNCYVFGMNGDWHETGAPTAGTWTQDSNGASTTYSVDAMAQTPIGPVPLLQVGKVSPAGGRGVLQLEAASTIQAFGLEFLSVGSEIDPGAAELLCPTIP